MSNHLTIVFAMAAAFIGGAAAAQTPGVKAGHPVLELRQYKIVPGAREKFIPLFDKEFVETQEALGIRIIGQFRDHDRPDRFTWVREIPSMAARPDILKAFYFGPVWAKFKTIANPMLDDNDNVLLLRAARENSGFGPSRPRPAVGAKPGHTDTYFAVIEYLWKDPNEGFSNFFLDQVAPKLKAAGLPVLGVYVPEEEPNNFPRLPTRPDKKMLVWFTKAANADAFDAIRAKLRSSRAWKDGVARELDSAEERAPQVLRLDPTPRSALR